ncbi:MAG: hypothetical protein U0414_35610 [Polyangiaceae bacterium]
MSSHDRAPARPARPDPFLRAAATVLLVVLPSLTLGACGGSASETPWPVEPDNVDLGPVGESRAEEAGTASPASSGSPSDRAEPAMDDATVAPPRKKPSPPPAGTPEVGAPGPL